ATSAEASPTAPDQTSSPVAGSVETSLPAIGAGFTSAALSSTLRCIRPHRLRHPADGCNLVVEEPPVVTRGDRRPDRLDLVDVHRAGLAIGPVRMRARPVAAVEQACEIAEGVRGVALRPRVAAAAPVEEDAVDRRLARRQRLDQRFDQLAVIGGGSDTKTPQHGTRE